MPCYDYEGEMCHKDAHKKLDKLTRLLCAVGHYVAEDGEWSKADMDEFREWFEEHKKLDAERKGRHA